MKYKRINNKEEIQKEMMLCRKQIEVSKNAIVLTQDDMDAIFSLIYHVCYGVIQSTRYNWYNTNKGECVHKLDDLLDSNNDALNSFFSSSSLEMFMSLNIYSQTIDSCYEELNKKIVPYLLPLINAADM